MYRMYVYKYIRIYLYINVQCIHFDQNRSQQLFTDVIFFLPGPQNSLDEFLLIPRGSQYISCRIL